MFTVFPPASTALAVQSLATAYFAVKGDTQRSRVQQAVGQAQNVSVAHIRFLAVLGNS